MLLRQGVALILVLFAAHPLAHADENLRPLKKWVVFPFGSADSKLQPTIEQAWWNVREKITEKKRFSVASRQFLIDKEVFQPRKELSPDDVKYLSTNLDADLLITGFSEYRDFTLCVYLSQNGQLLWKKRLGFHPSLKGSEQLLNVSQRIINEFLDKLPYHGVTVSLSEPIDKTPHAVALDLGNTENLNLGDDINLLKLSVPEDKADFNIEKISSQTLATGKIIKLKKNIAVIDTKSFSLPTNQIFFAYVLKDKNENSYQSNLLSELAPTQESDVGRVNSHSKQTVIFGSVFSFLGLLLLAF